MGSQDTAAWVTELLALEAEHRRATTSQDVATLAALLGEKMHFTHVDGRTDTKADILAQASGQVGNPLTGLQVAVEAEEIDVGVYGEVGVLTGQHRISVGGRDPLASGIVAAGPLAGNARARSAGVAGVPSPPPHGDKRNKPSARHSADSNAAISSSSPAFPDGKGEVG